MTINNIYDVPVFIINMPNRKDRKEHMIKLIKELGFKKYTFIEPYKADENTKLFFEKLIKRKSKLPMTKISHNMTYLNLLNINVEKMIILEDDIILTQSIEDTKNDLEYIFYNTPKDATMIYMEMCFEKCNKNVIYE
jgi:GR25 family glycosyltransferase involved in LPS biosynthesis